MDDQERIQYRVNKIQKTGKEPIKGRMIFIAVSVSMSIVCLVSYYYIQNLGEINVANCLKMAEGIGFANSKIKNTFNIMYESLALKEKNLKIQGKKIF